MGDRNVGFRRRWLRRLVFLGALILAGLIFRAWSRPSVPADSVLLVDLRGDYAERPADPWEQLLDQRPGTFLELLTGLRDASLDERIRAVVLRIRPLDLGWARAEDIRDAIASLRKAGKPVHAYLEQEAANGTLEYYIAAAARRISAPSSATVPLAGLRAEMFFFRDLLDRWNIEVEVARRREYKTAADMLVRRRMSPQQREMTERLLDGIYTRVVEAVAADRGLEPDAVQRIIDAAPITARELKDAGLLDSVRSLEDLRIELVGAEGRFLSLADYLRAGGWKGGQRGARDIAVVYLSGPITLGEASGGIREGAAGADRIVRALRDAAADESVGAIVLRVASPGGSALASDLIWQAVRQAREKKPVVASFGDVAASGGYYAASAATRIVTRVTTVTGSIGVVLARPALGGFLEEIGVRVDEAHRGRLSHLTSLTEPLEAEGRARIEQVLDQVYGTFLERVAAGREMSVEAVDAVGGARVWTGADAVEIGLADEPGGFLDALDRAKDLAGIGREKRVGIVTYPPPRPLIQRLLGWLVAHAQLSISMPEPLRHAWWDGARAFHFARGGVLAHMPFSIRIR